jgi:hypothetical protein
MPVMTVVARHAGHDGDRDERGPVPVAPSPHSDHRRVGAITGDAHAERKGRRHERWQQPVQQADEHDRERGVRVMIGSP